MIDIVVKTQWQGTVAIRQQFLEQAEDKQEDIMVFHDKGFMRIPWHEVYTRAQRRSEYKMRDRFNKYPPGYLYYYNWKPEVSQGVLV